MLLAVHPKLPMRNKAATFDFYVHQLGFEPLNDMDTYPDYLMVCKDQIEIHFFLFPDLDIATHDGMCYIRTDNVDDWYRLAVDKKLDIPALGHLKEMPWYQKEFALRDPDNNLLTFGENTWKG
jgi:catechol 2,3-dioxygenase-like lactoylglutathione lyase family enzyme